MSQAKREKGKRGKGTASDRQIDVHLTDAVELLHKHVTEGCRVFSPPFPRCRNIHRQDDLRCFCA
jgi:hypothetical protein